MTAPLLTRSAFKTSHLLDFCSRPRPFSNRHVDVKHFGN
jgi:hypothetical protein